MPPRKIIIVGATSGIGRTLARMYATAGWKVGVTGRRMALLESLSEEFNADQTSAETTPKQIMIECFDVTGTDNIRHIQSLLEKLGGLDLLLYNSGFGDVTENLEWETDRQTIYTNVNGFTEITNWAFNYFQKKGVGHIAATSSISANRGNSFAPAYSASKAFMSTYMEGLYLKARKLKVNIYITDIQPGFVKTKMAKGNKQFWVVPVEKACKQIYTAIERKRFRVYISRRWWLIAKLMKLVPLSFYKQFG
jgi:short-subunit dehydrogenase